MQTKLKDSCPEPPPKTPQIVVLIKANCAPDARVYAGRGVGIGSGVQNIVVVRKFTSFAFSHTHLTDAVSTAHARPESKRYRDTNVSSTFSAFRLRHAAKSRNQRYMRIRNIVYIDIVNCPQQLSPPKSGTVVANDWKMKSIPLCGDHISNHVLSYSQPIRKFSE